MGANNESAVLKVSSQAIQRVIDKITELVEAVECEMTEASPAKLV